MRNLTLRLRSQRFSLGSLQLLIAATLAACTGGSDVREGRLQRVVVDRPERGESAIEYLLEADDGSEIELGFADAPPALETGARLRVTGTLQSPSPDRFAASVRPRLAVTDVEVQAPALEEQQQALIPTAPPAPRKLAVFLFNFQNDDREPLSVEEARRKIFTDPRSVRAFHKEQSYGFVDLAGKVDKTGDVFGWFTIAANNRPCAEGQWDDLALAQAAAKGIDTTGYDHYVFIFPYTDACLYGGRGQQPGKNTWINGGSITVMNHELGHNFGTPHASTLNCTNAAGTRVTLSDNCRTTEYGNPFDVMGHGYRHTNAFNKARARWLGPNNIQNVGKDGVYTLYPQERPSNDVQLLSTVATETTAYYVEYRQPFGYDDFAPTSAAASGIMILLGQGLRTLTNSYLLDTTPVTTTFADAPLAVGKTFVAPKGDVKITLVERDAASAKVRFEFPGGSNSGTLNEPDGGVRPDANVRTDAGASGDAVQDGSPREAGRELASDAQAVPGTGGAGGSGTGGGGTGGSETATTSSGGSGGRTQSGGRSGRNEETMPPPEKGGGCDFGGPTRAQRSWLLPIAAWLFRVGRRRPRTRALPWALALVMFASLGVPACQNENEMKAVDPARTGGAGGGRGGKTTEPPMNLASGGRTGTGTGGTGAPPSIDAGANDVPAANAPDASGDAPGSSDAGPPVSRITMPAAPPAIATACARYAEVYCARLDACVTDGVRLNYGEMKFCRARREVACRQDLLTPGRSETTERRQSCTDALAKQSCRDYYFGRPLPACDYPPGNLKEGAPCFRSSQCGMGLSCEIETDEACGTCMPTLPIGGDCSFWTAGCPLGTYCYADQCLAPLGIGDPCKKTAASCLGGMACTQEGCIEKNGDVGADCSKTDICDTVKGLYCNLMTGKCTPNPAGVEVGKPCSVVDASGARSRCGADATCFAPPASPTRRVCVARVGAGAKCDNAVGPLCDPPGECVRGQCVVPIIVDGPAPTFRTCP
jgi:Gametolysin peptidase M11